MTDVRQGEKAEEGTERSQAGGTTLNSPNLVQENLDGPISGLHDLLLIQLLGLRSQSLLSLVCCHEPVSNDYIWVLGYKRRGNRDLVCLGPPIFSNINHLNKIKY